METLADRILSAYRRYENALQTLQKGDYFRMADMNPSTWQDQYGIVRILGIKYLEEAKRIISNATDRALKNNDAWAGAGYDSFGGHGYDANLADAPRLASVLISLLGVTGLDPNAIGQWTDDQRRYLNDEIERLQKDANRVADELEAARKSYFGEGGASGGGAAPGGGVPPEERRKSISEMESLAVALKKNTDNLPRYLESLRNGTSDFGQEGRDRYKELVRHAYNVIGTIDEFGRVKSSKSFITPFMSDAEKFAHVILAYNYGKGSSRNPTRPYIEEEQSRELRGLENTLGIQSSETFRKLGNGEGASPRQLAAAALYTDHRIYRLMNFLKSKVGPSLGADLDRAITAGDRDTVSRLFSSSRTDSEKSVSEAHEVMSRREDAKALADQVRGMKNQDINKYMEFLYYYLNCGSEEEEMGLTPYWEGDAVLENFRAKVTGWDEARLNGGVSRSFSERVAEMGGSPGTYRAFRYAEENPPWLGGRRR